MATDPTLRLSDAVATGLARRGIHYGWAVAAVTFLTMLVTAGAVGAPGVLILPLQKEFGWDTATIGSALAVRLVLFGLMGPFAAALMNRYGPRRIVLMALALIAGGLLASLGMTRVWQLVLLWGVVVGIGTGLTALVLGATVATRWFSRSRGLVVGLLTASSATGQLVVLPLLAALTEALGWRAALLVICALLLTAGLGVVALMRDRPEDLGLAPYGETRPPAAPAASAAPGPSAGGALSALREAAATRVFWVLFATFFICGASTNGLIQTHFIPLCADYGIGPVQGASVLAAMGVFDFVGTVASGWLSDRYDNRWLLFWYYGLRGLSLMFLPFSDFSFVGLSLFAVFYGLDWIATVPPTVRLTAARFGRERANLVFGWVFAGHQLGAATIAYGAGLSRAELATYLPAFFAAGALCLAAALLILTLGRPAAPGVPAATPARA
ncbi:MFS transporter [Methylobacterium sp. Leaf104]|uniref:MFS transporter n=1 Tax=Methylobacterium TaxID=407 RepID=UPI0006F9F0ED|nr:MULTISPECIES: MFS transporter [Methylobacterium]KQP38481.1 MFS transporter [Methylobacterium sp. Leaf104]MCI9880097.1 MFS transporter [Methylobacterium goesingense]